MGIISKVQNLSLTDPKAWNPSLWNMIGSQSLSGENVTEFTAFTYSAFWNAVTLIAGTIGALPLHLKRRDGKTTENAVDEKLYRVLHDQANPFMAAMNFRETMKAHVLTWGNCYAEKKLNGFGEVLELWPIPPNRIVDMRLIKGQIWYFVRVDNQDIPIPRTHMMHIPGLGFDGYRGYSVVSMARKSLGLSMAMETFGALYFGNGTHPGLVVSHPTSLSTTTKKNLEASLNVEYSGLGKSHKLLLLEEAMKVENIGIPPGDSQFLESRQFQVTEVARWFNLPPHKLKDLTRSSFNNIESEQNSFVIDTILPWLVRFEQNYNMQLLTPSQQKEKLFTKHIVEGLLRGNARDRAIFYKTMWNNGFITQNEVREKEEFNPSTNVLADELFVPLNMVPLSQYDSRLTETNALATISDYAEFKGKRKAAREAIGLEDI